MKNSLFHRLVVLLLGCSVSILALDDAATIRELGQLYDKGNRSLQTANIKDALNYFKHILNAKIQAPRFEEFSYKIQAAEKIVEIYQRLNDLSHVEKYTVYVKKNYENAFSELNRQGDIEHALMIARILSALLCNKGSYVSISGQNYEFPLSVKNVFESTALKQNCDFYSKYVNDVHIMPYKKGLDILANSAGKADRQKVSLENQALQLFMEAEKINPDHFKLLYQLAVMYKDGIGTSKNLINADLYATRALDCAQNSDEKDSAKELIHLIKVDQTINQSKKMDAKDLADRGFEKLKQFQKPPQESSVKGFDTEALQLLGKSSVFDSSNFQVEYKLAEMYLNGMGTRRDATVARWHAKRALKIAADINNDEMIAQAKKLIDQINVEYFKVLISKDSEISAEETSDFSNGSKRKSVFGIFKK